MEEARAQPELALKERSTLPPGDEARQWRM